MESRRKKRTFSGTISKVDLLACSICCDILKAPIYQCQFGHTLCKECWPKIGFKCPSCKLPLGANRLTVLEKFIRSTVVMCPNAPACTEKIPYSKKEKHVAYGCVVSKVLCPNYVLCEAEGEPDWIMDHFIHAHWNSERYKSYFDFDSPIKLDLIANLEVWYLFCWMSPVLFTFQCFKDEGGVFIQVSYLAPPASATYHYSYELTYSFKGRKVTYVCSEMPKKIKMSYEYPEETNSVFIAKDQMQLGEMNLLLKISA